jgi:hypothetical protein
MTLDFDLTSFIEDMKACKPPYKCPFCGRVYKTFSGMTGHIQSHDVQGSRGGSGAATPRSPSPQPFFGSPIKESVAFDELAKKIEFEADGRLHRLSIFETLEIVDRKDWEATLPPKATEDQKKTEDEDEEAASQNSASVNAAGSSAATPKTPKTPSMSRFNKKKKTPRSKPQYHVIFFVIFPQGYDKNV